MRTEADRLAAVLTNVKARLQLNHGYLDREQRDGELISPDGRTAVYTHYASSAGRVLIDLLDERGVRERTIAYQVPSGEPGAVGADMTAQVIWVAGRDGEEWL